MSIGFVSPAELRETQTAVKRLEPDSDEWVEEMAVALALEDAPQEPIYYHIGNFDVVGRERRGVLERWGRLRDFMTSLQNRDFIILSPAPPEQPRAWFCQAAPSDCGRSYVETAYATIGGSDISQYDYPDDTPLSRMEAFEVMKKFAQSQTRATGYRVHEFRYPTEPNPQRQRSN